MLNALWQQSDYLVCVQGLEIPCDLLPLHPNESLSWNAAHRLRQLLKSSLEICSVVSWEQRCSKTRSTAGSYQGDWFLLTKLRLKQFHIVLVCVLRSFYIACIVVQKWDFFSKPKIGSVDEARVQKICKP